MKSLINLLIEIAFITLSNKFIFAFHQIYLLVIKF